MTYIKPHLLPHQAFGKAPSSLHLPEKAVHSKLLGRTDNAWSKMSHYKQQGERKSADFSIRNTMKESFSETPLSDNPEPKAPWQMTKWSAKRRKIIPADTSFHNARHVSYPLFNGLKRCYLLNWTSTLFWICGFTGREGRLCLLKEKVNGDMNWIYV